MTSINHGIVHETGSLSSTREYSLVEQEAEDEDGPENADQPEEVPDIMLEEDDAKASLGGFISLLTARLRRRNLLGLLRGEPAEYDLVPSAFPSQYNPQVNSMELVYQANVQNTASSGLGSNNPPVIYKPDPWQDQGLHGILYKELRSKASHSSADLQGFLEHSSTYPMNEGHFLRSDY